MSSNGKNGNTVTQGRGKDISGLIPYQFKPGQSGNPAGGKQRPRFENFANEVDAKLAYDNLVESMKNKESWAITYYLDQFFGKPRQRTEITGENGGPVEFSNARDEFERKLARLANAEETGAIPESN